MKNYLPWEQMQELINKGIDLDLYRPSLHFDVTDIWNVPAYNCVSNNMEEKYKYPTYSLADLENYLVKEGYTFKMKPMAKSRETGIVCKKVGNIFALISHELIDLIFYCVTKDLEGKNLK